MSSISIRSNKTFLSLLSQLASFCCNTVVDGIVFSSGMFIDPIKDDLGASKATVALVGSLLSGFYLIVGPFVSGKPSRTFSVV